MSQKSYNNSPSLYIIPTPIGNIEDMTIRGIKILRSVDYIFSEDTRETIKLLKKYAIKKPLIPYHKFNEDKVQNDIINKLSNGNSVALVSDRGTPCISDPGYVASYNAIKKGYNVISLPGPTAFVPALVMSGINPNNFLFYGFLDSKKTRKEKQLEELKSLKYTIIFYESPYRVIETINLIKEIFGDRNLCVSREISKKYEEIYRGTPDDILKELIDPKGEFVIIVEGEKKLENYDDIDIVDQVNLFIEQGLTKKEAIKKVSKLRKIEKNIVYMKYNGGKE